MVIEMKKLDYAAIQKIIPHRDPMLLVSTVEELEPGKRIVATFYVNPEREIFKGHFPEEPVLPGVYSVESMAQAACILLLSTERYAGKVPLLIEINRAKFFQKVFPGDTIEIRATLTKDRPEVAITTCTAKIYNHGRMTASAEVTLAMR